MNASYSRSFFSQCGTWKRNMDKTKLDEYDILCLKKIKIRPFCKSFPNANIDNKNLASKI